MINCVNQMKIENDKISVSNFKLKLHLHCGQLRVYWWYACFILVFVHNLIILVSREKGSITQIQNKRRMFAMFWRKSFWNQLFEAFWKFNKMGRSGHEQASLAYLLLALFFYSKSQQLTLTFFTIQHWP